MPNQKTELFLDYWRRLETADARVVGSDSRINAVLRLCRDPRFSAYREQLDYCREVRNLLSHQAKVDGEYAVYPSDAVLELLQTVLRKLEDPPRVTEVMTPLEKLVTAYEDDQVLDIMRQMRSRSLSHVPVLKGNHVVGVFSVETVFQGVLDSKWPIDRNTTFGEYTDYLPTENHMGFDYRFISRGTTLDNAELMFEKANKRNRKLKLLLVTRTGDENEPLLGVVTPYDLMGND